MNNKIIVVTCLLFLAQSAAQQRQEKREQRREERREHRRREQVQPRAGEPWRDILDPSRAIDWSHQGAVIPTNFTKCDTTAMAGGSTGFIIPSGVLDVTDGTNINNALQNCPEGTYVPLGEGTFYITNGLTFGTPNNNKGFTILVNNKSLRGLGPDKTILKNMSIGAQTECSAQATAICIAAAIESYSSFYWPPAGSCNWIAGYGQGNTTLTLDTATCYTGPYSTGQTGNQNGIVKQSNGMPSAGMYIMLDQRNDDIGLKECHSSGPTATCTVTLPTLPSEFQVGKCVGTSNVGNVSNINPVKLWAAGTTYSLYALVRDSNGNIQRATVANAASGASPPVSWATTPGATTNDGAQIWAVSGQWLPNQAYTVWSSSASGNPNTQIILQNGMVLRVKQAGTSGGTQPSWTNTFGSSSTATTVGDQADGSVIWYLAFILGYNQTMYSPKSVPNSCNPITNISGNTFSYTLNNNAANLASVGPCTPGPSDLPLASPCGFALADNEGLMMGGIDCVTVESGCPQETPNPPTFAKNGGAMEQGRFCPFSRNTACIGGQTGEISRRTQSQVVQVLSSNPSTGIITIDTPLFADNWRASQQPGVWWYSYMHHDIGIENLTIDAFQDGGSKANSTIRILQCYNCWIRNIRSLGGSRSHVWMSDGVDRMTIRDSYFYGTKRGSNQSYGIEADINTGNMLIENNIFMHIVCGVCWGGGFGSVVSYNYVNDDGFSPVNNMMAGTQNHVLGGYNLFESNNVAKDTSDNLHGTGLLGVVSFRVRMRGQAFPIKSNYLTANQINTMNRGMSFIGNIMGTCAVFPATTPTSCVQNGGYQVVGGTTGASRWVWDLGRNSQTDTAAPDDPYVWQTLLRWGNYDVYTGASTAQPRWCDTGSEAGCNPCGGATVNCSEIPGAFTFMPANQHPASHTLPSSFYLTAKPLWYATKWGTSPWPSIGPDVTGGNAPDGTCAGVAGCTDAGSGMAYPIPSQIVQQNMPLDTLYLTYNRIDQCSFAVVAFVPIATCTGQFTMPAAATFTVTGMAPVDYNGTYSVYSTNEPIGEAGNLPYSLVTGGNLAYRSYRVQTSRMNQFGETIPAIAARISPATTCPSSSATCTIRILGASLSGNGSGTAAASSYNIYMSPESGPDIGAVCKQNTSPVPLGTSFDITDFVGPSNGTCIRPPTINTAYSTQIQYLLWGVSSLANGTGGTLTGPLVQVFNADNYYGTGVTPPTTAPAGITGHGQITGQGKIT